MAELPGVRSKVGLGGSGEKYQLVLTGEDPQTLLSAATAVERELRTIPGLGSISSSASLIRTEVAVRPDFARAADLGVNSNAISETLRIATMGDYDQSLPKLNLSQRQVPIVVKLTDSARQDLDLLGRLTVPGVKGPVMLSQVAALEVSGGPAVIDRLNRSRNITFEVELSDVPLGDVTAAVNKLPAIQNLPPGVKQLALGDAEVMGELFASFGLAMLTGVLCIYIVLVLLFKDFLQPITILAALPLSLGGAFVGLLIANQSFSMPSLIGLIMLMGIATKNSILLVEYAIESRRYRYPSLNIAGFCPSTEKLRLDPNYRDHWRDRLFRREFVREVHNQRFPSLCLFAVEKYFDFVWQCQNQLKQFFGHFFGE
jgi:multidrug efflux pump subunit AcrB